MVINFSGALLRFVNFQKSVSIEAGTVGEALEVVATRFPNAKPVIYDTDGNVRKVHQLFLNGRQVNSQEIGMPVQGADRLDVMTAIAGG